MRINLLYLGTSLLFFLYKIFLIEIYTGVPYEIRSGLQIYHLGGEKTFIQNEKINRQICMPLS